MAWRRRFLFLPVALAGALIAAAPAPAQQVTTSAAPDAVAVTVYRAPDRAYDDAMDLGWLQGFALVTEKRTVDIPAGRSTIRFEGVAGGMLPESALVSGLPAGVREKNLDADLLSPASLYARSFGRPVILRRLHDKSGKVTEQRAIIRSGVDGSVILQTAEGFEAANCGPLNETLVYPEVPQGLSARPTLSVETEAPEAARVTLSLSYLAWGFDWQTNYVVHMLDGGKRADIAAWVTLASSDPTSFADAETAVVAGKINRADREDGPGGGDGQLVYHCFFTHLEGYAPPPPPAAAPAEFAGDIVVTAQRRSQNLMSAPVTVVQEELGDLKLYRVPIPTTVASNAQKQVAMFDKRGVKVAIVYAASIEDDDVRAVMVKLRARNEEKDGLGIALPAGPAAVFEELNGEPMLAGLGAIRDSAVGEKVEITLATATQVRFLVEQTADGRDKRGDYWRKLVLSVTNANPWPVAFEAELQVNDGEEVAQASSGLGRKNGRPLWEVRVPANGSARLRYRLQTIGAKKGHSG